MASTVSARQPWRTQRRCARTEKSCGPDARGLCVKSCGDVRPTGTRIDQPQGDGGNSASLPGESTKDTVKTIAQGRPGDRQHLSSTPCAFFAHAGLRVPAGARPSLRPCFQRVRDQSKARAKQAARTRSCVRAIIEQRSRAPEAAQRVAGASSRGLVKDGLGYIARVALPYLMIMVGFVLLLTMWPASSRFYRGRCTGSCEREAAATFVRSKLAMRDRERLRHRDGP